MLMMGDAFWPGVSTFLVILSYLLPRRCPDISPSNLLPFAPATYVRIGMP